MLCKGFISLSLPLDSWNFIFGVGTGFHTQHHLDHSLAEVHQLWSEWKVVQRLYLLRLWKSNASKCIHKNWAWQLAYVSEKGKFWVDCCCSAPFIYFTWNKSQEYPDLSVPCWWCPAAGSCLFLVGLQCFSLPPTLASFACTDSAGGWSTRRSVPVFGVISFKMWVCPGMYVGWKSLTAWAGWGVKDKRMDYITRCVLKREYRDVLGSCEK